MNVLDLFSGIGGFSLGLERAGMQTVAFCEKEPFCRAILAKHWPGIPCYEDVCTLTADRLVRDGIRVDVICGGFPCQDISFAGKGAGLAGKRSGLWYEFHRLISEIQPHYAIIENVAALRSRGLDAVLRSLFEIGYDAEWHCIPASAIGAPHRRDRIWITAYRNADNQGESTRTINDEAFRLPIVIKSHWANGEWISPPKDFRVDDGISGTMDRVRALGNAVVPQIPEIIGKAIMDKIK